MPRKRSRTNTEQRFQDAVIELVGESGCAHLGVNNVALRAGSDKVLIYRYFGNLEGLLQRVAESRPWLPNAEELLSSLSVDPSHALKELARLIVDHIRIDAATHQLSLWRHVVKNPLTAQFNNEWKTLWQTLSREIASGLNYDARQNWAKACTLLALIIQSELADEAVDSRTIEALAEQLEGTSTTARNQNNFQEDGVESLPTNLL